MIGGKGVFIWQGKACAKGSLGDAVQACKLAGLSWVALKIGDSIDRRYQSYTDMPAAVRAFREAGMQVWGWHYVYGGIRMDRNGTATLSTVSPEDEARFAIDTIEQLRLDGYIIDAEKEYKASGQGKRARQFMQALGKPGAPVALASYRFPSLHQEFPWSAFLTGCDLHMPQVYWNPGGSIRELRDSYRQLVQLRQIPIVPIGRAYIGDGHPGPQPEEIEKFMVEAERLKCPAFSFWSLDAMYNQPGGGSRMAAIAKHPPAAEGGIPPSPAEIGGTYRVKAWVLRVRSSPGMNGNTMRFLLMGNRVTVRQIRDLGSLEKWAEIGPDEWVSMKWLEAV